MITSQFCPVCGAVNETSQHLCFACGQTLSTASTDLQSGALLLGRYQILTTLGTGGFSVVYLVRDLMGEGSVAVKQISLEGLSSEEVIDATDTFNREINLLSMLHH